MAETFTDKGMRDLNRLRKAANDLAEGIESSFFVKFGIYQPKWSGLAERTKAIRVKQGYPEDEPLLRSGVTRDSFTREVEATETSITIIVGIKTGTIRKLPYDERPKDIGQLMCWHERGTATEPPRPMLPLVADEVTKMLTDLFDRGSVSIMSGAR
jgi:hypothetical protein